MSQFPGNFSVFTQLERHFSPGYLFKCLWDPMGSKCLPWQPSEAAMPASQTFKGMCHPWGGEVGSRDTELRIPVRAINKNQWYIPVLAAAL